MAINKIKKNRGGITMDADYALAFRQKGGWTDEQLQKHHPIYTETNRVDRLRQLLNPENPKYGKRTINIKNEAVNKAMKQLNQIVEDGEKLLEKGLNPNNPKDREQFKKFPRESLARVATALGTQYSQIKCMNTNNT